MMIWISMISAALLLFGNAMAAGQEEMVEKIRKSFQEPTVEGLVPLFRFEGVDPELANAQKQMLEYIAAQKLPVSEFAVHDFDKYVPEPPLPGQFRGKELEYGVAVKKWVVMTMEKKDGTTTRKIKLVIPLAEEGGNWFVPVAKYKAAK